MLIDKHNSIVILTRTPEKINGSCTGINHLSQIPDEMFFDVVINLAGEPIADKRWSDEQKNRILKSRIETTQFLIDYLNSKSKVPELLINGSAIGYYGVDASDEEITELHHGDDSFSSHLCQQWETIAEQAQGLGIRTCMLRTGIVLGKHGGALKKMLPAFKLGIGGRIGNGAQWMSWIHIDDLIGIILYCIEHNDISGPINGTSPNPVTNTTFSKVLGQVLNRPAVLPMPAFVIKFLMGQMGEELLISGKKVIPAKILNHGYSFKYPQLAKALLHAT